MKGNIRVESKENKGSNFIIAFPVNICKEVPQFSGMLDEGKDLELFKGKACLLLDDYPENTYIMKEVLNRFGLTAICSQNGLEALEKFKAGVKMDVIITDLRMPVMTGQAFILEVRKFEMINNKPRVPIIVVTAESSIEEKKACLTRYGANEYLIKPIKCQDLIAAIARVFTVDAPSKKRNILIIDDDALSARFLLTVLADDGHTCIVSHSVREVRAIPYPGRQSKFSSSIIMSITSFSWTTYWEMGQASIS